MPKSGSIKVKRFPPKEPAAPHVSPGRYGGSSKNEVSLMPLWHLSSGSLSFFRSQTLGLQDTDCLILIEVVIEGRLAFVNSFELGFDGCVSI